MSVTTLITMIACIPAYGLLLLSRSRPIKIKLPEIKPKAVKAAAAAVCVCAAAYLGKNLAYYIKAVDLCKEYSAEMLADNSITGQEIHDRYMREGLGPSVSIFIPGCLVHEGVIDYSLEWQRLYYSDFV